MENDLLQIIKEKNERLGAIPDEFVSNLDVVNKSIFEVVLTYLQKMKSEGENIVISKRNLVNVDLMIDDIKKSLMKGKYLQYVKDFVDEFDEQAKLNSDYFSTSFEKYEPTAIEKVILKKSQQDAMDMLVAQPMDQNFLTPVRAELERAVVSGASLTDTIKSMRELIEGTVDKPGKLLQYTKQVSNDSFALADRTYSHAIASDLDVEWYMYTGEIIADSREFCIQRDGKYFHKKEVEAWALLQWQGKMKGTNGQTIFITCGGYNCKHALIPVSISSVPISVIKRNMANGNFKPSEFEKEELGL